MQPGGAAPAAPPPGMAMGAGAPLPAGASFASLASNFLKNMSLPPPGGGQ